MNSSKPLSKDEALDVVYKTFKDQHMLFVKYARSKKIVLDHTKRIYQILIHRVWKSEFCSIWLHGLLSANENDHRICYRSYVYPANDKAILFKAKTNDAVEEYINKAGPNDELIRGLTLFREHSEIARKHRARLIELVCNNQDYIDDDIELLITTANNTLDELVYRS